MVEVEREPEEAGVVSGGTQGTTQRFSSPLALTVLAAVVLAAAPAAGQPATEFPDLPPSLRPFNQRLVEEGALNRVLNLERLGLAAMRLGQREVAKRALDMALDRMEHFYVDSETVAKVRSRWYEEGCKEFLGEPYERAMAYLYRGILHMQDGEFDDARACFGSAILQDAFAEEQQHRCDFALLVYLHGLACRAQGDVTGEEDSFADASLLMPHQGVRIRRKTRYVLIVETGGAPRKLADGLGHGELRYARPRNRVETSAVVVRGRSERQAEMFEDIYFQAATRGGRGVDKIIEGKVIFQKKTVAAGSDISRTGGHLGAIGSAAVDADLMGVGVGLSIIGGVTQLFAAKAKPRVDTRHWDNLAESVLLFELPQSAADRPYQLRYLDVHGAEIERYRHQVRVDPGCQLPLCTMFIPSPTHIGERSLSETEFVAVATGTSAQTAATPDQATHQEPITKLHVGQGLIGIKSGEVRSGQGTSVSHVPGFEMRGHEGAVIRDRGGETVLGLGLDIKGGPGTATAERVEVLLYNFSDDLVAVISIRPAYGSTGLPWSPGLLMPLELDLQETVVLLAAAPEAFIEIETFTLTMELESAGTQEWTIHSNPH